MLCQLTIENIALVTQMELELPPGLTVITGETGAGKSILIDALMLALGSRAEIGLIRSGSESASVTARFAPPEDHPVWSCLQQRELDRGEGGILLRRMLNRTGRSRAFINDQPVTIATLAEIGDMLVDLHGQHDHQSLLNPVAHLTVLDAFAGHKELLAKTRVQFELFRQLREQLQRIQENARTAMQRRSFVVFQLEELAALQLQSGEWEELKKRQLRLSHTTRLALAAEKVLDLLTEESTAVRVVLGRAATTLEESSRTDPELLPLASTARSLFYEIEDLAQNIRHYLDGLENNPHQLTQLEDRLDQIQRLCRKHHCEAEDLLVLEERWQEELEALDRLESDEEQLTKRLLSARSDYFAISSILGESRQQAAKQLTQGVCDQLGDLYMPKTRFHLSLSPRDGEPHALGNEEVAFQISANPGEPPQALHKIASGGEMARIMLALKAILADAVTVPTLIFDEVDVGVGGRVATAIGDKMAQVARKDRQVLAITHQPQVAAIGEHHLKVEKKTIGDRTFVTATFLSHADKIEELARMLAGKKITDTARQNAIELMQMVRR
ncbi:MAG: DNA repair protein RecN [Magnetococcus sp. DMHC-6]